MIYSRNLKGFYPFAAYQALGLSLIFLLFIYLFQLNSTYVTYVSLLSLILCILLFLTFHKTFIKSCFNLKNIETSTDRLIYTDKNGQKIEILFKDIISINFISATSYYIDTMYFYLGKNFGYFQIRSTDNKKINISPTAENRDLLIKEVIEKSKLKKVPPSMLSNRYNSWLKKTEPQNELDLDVSPRKISNLYDYAIIFIVAVVIFIFAFLFMIYINR